MTTLPKISARTLARVERAVRAAWSRAQNARVCDLKDHVDATHGYIELHYEIEYTWRGDTASLESIRLRLMHQDEICAGGEGGGDVRMDPFNFPAPEQLNAERAVLECYMREGCLRRGLGVRPLFLATDEELGEITRPVTKLDAATCSPAGVTRTIHGMLAGEEIEARRSESAHDRMARAAAQGGQKEAA